MSGNQSLIRNERILFLGLPILVLIASLFFGLWDIFNKPDLTYEHSSYSLPSFPAGESMILIIIRNEGRAPAEEVTVKVKVNGETKNVFVLERDIAGEIPPFELFGESVGIDIKDSSSIITIPYIAKGMKYTTGLMIKPQDDELIKTLIVHSRNGGLAQKYTAKGRLTFKSLGLGFIAGVSLTVLSVFLRKKFRGVSAERTRRPREKSEPKR